MAKTRKVKIPHHIKERFRHQNLQRLLEHVASHVPQPPGHKPETKAKKLRRIVLYMRFLLQKEEELSEKSPEDPTNTSTSEVRDANKVIENGKRSSMGCSEVKSKSRLPQIVFLRKVKDEVVSQSVARSSTPGTAANELDTNESQQAINHETSLANSDRSFNEPHLEISSFSDNSVPYSGTNASEFHSLGDLKEDRYRMENHSLTTLKRPLESNSLYELPSKKRSEENSYLASHSTPFPVHENPSLVSYFRDRISSGRNSYVADTNFHEKYVFGTEKKLTPSSTYIPKRSPDDYVDQNKYFYCQPDARNDQSSSHVDSFPFDYFSSGESAPFASSGESARIVSSGESGRIHSSGESAPILSGEWFSSDEMEYGSLIEEHTPEFCGPTSTEKVMPESAVLAEDSPDICDGSSNSFCHMEQFGNSKQLDNVPYLYTQNNFMLDPSLYMVDSEYAVRNPDYNAARYVAFNDRENGMLVNQSEYIHGHQQKSLVANKGKKNMKTSVESACKNVSPNCYLDDMEVEDGFDFMKLDTGHTDGCYSEDISTGKLTQSNIDVDNYNSDIYVPNGVPIPSDFNEDCLNSGLYRSSISNAQNERSRCQLKEEEFGHSRFKVRNCDYDGIKREDLSPLPAEETSYNLNNFDWLGLYLNKPK